ISVDYLQRHQFVVPRADSRHEEQRCIPSVHHFGICFIPFVQVRTSLQPRWNSTPLYSKNLHILVLRARTSCVTSFTIFALDLGGSVVNHFASRTLPTDSLVSPSQGALWPLSSTPCRDTSRM